ncbi:MAG: 3-phosphoshikimate 1-carboxyvinyltransferase [Bacteroidales bacterium OttesenSCG-928-I14]|jgi:3-phosphoshikimate 1-carboxyvinyltransferase|nr:3-phosphoshikimate 1-carboxyvinyltransferase [Bacteroidales bacterium OttesenSCG-928-I14]
MIYKVQPPTNLYINTSVKLPASKSISNRILILSALSKKKNEYFIDNLSNSDDTQILARALQSSHNDFDVGSAGTAMRFLTAYLAQRDGNWNITGNERMKNRPIRELTNVLYHLGAEINFLGEKGFPPLSIVGKKLKGGLVSVDSEISSQYVSALMMIAPVLEQGLILKLRGDVISKPYIKMTAHLMNIFDVKVEWMENLIKIVPQSYHAHPFKIENDWSAASYWYEIMAFSLKKSSIKLLGLEENSIQGDARGRFLFEKLGVKTEFVFSTCSCFDKNLTISNDLKKKLNVEYLYYDFINEPDLVQTFVVSCCLLGIHFYFKGVKSLRIKETDRVFALQKEMRKLGYVIENYSDNVIEWNGERCSKENNPIISTYGDHRMAMAFAPACLKLKEIIIDTPEVVSKSYPNYWKDLLQAGFIIKEI